MDIILKKLKHMLESKFIKMQVLMYFFHEDFAIMYQRYQNS